MVVRSKVDACLPPATEKPTEATSTVDQLVDSLSSMSITSQSIPPAVSGTPATDNSLLIIEGGSKIPQSAIVELQTRSETSKYPQNWQETYPQLFLSQTPHHYLGIHSRGRFHTCQKRELETDIENLVEVNLVQDNLKKLRRALKTIQQIVVQSGQRGRLSLVCQGNELRVFERSSQDSFLPDDIMQRFEI
jgi:hypothetical protein